MACTRQLALTAAADGDNVTLIVDSFNGSSTFETSYQAFYSDTECSGPSWDGSEFDPVYFDRVGPFAAYNVEGGSEGCFGAQMYVRDPADCTLEDFKFYWWANSGAVGVDELWVSAQPDSGWVPLPIGGSVVIELPGECLWCDCPNFDIAFTQGAEFSEEVEEWFVAVTASATPPPGVTAWEIATTSTSVGVPTPRLDTAVFPPFSGYAPGVPGSIGDLGGSNSPAPLMTAFRLRPEGEECPVYTFWVWWSEVTGSGSGSEATVYVSTDGVHWEQVVVGESTTLLAGTADCDCGADPPTDFTVTIPGDCTDCEPPPETPVPVTEGQLGVCTVQHYQVELLARGGGARVAPIEDVSLISYGRVLDGVSGATVTIAKRGGNCCEVVEAADPYATELRISRQGLTVWEGVVYSVEETQAGAVIEARDLSHWMERRIVRTTLDNSVVAKDPCLIAGDLVFEAFRFDDPNVLEYLLVIEGALPVTRKTDAANHPYAMTELADVARTSVDWTVVGRRIIIAPSDLALGRLDAVISDDSIIGDYRILKTGRDFASRQVTKGEGALVAVEGGRSPRYGLVESRNDEQSLTTQAAVENAAATRYRVTPRPPVWVSLDDGVRLRPTTPITLDQLVPGVVLPASFSRNCNKLQQDFRLQQVDVTANAEDEQVAIKATAIGYAFEEPDVLYQEMIVVGDSLSALNPDLQPFPPGRWPDLLLGQGDVSPVIINASVSGATSTALRASPPTSPRATGAFVLFLGANDHNESLSGVSPAEFKDNLLWFLDNFPATRQVVVWPWRWVGYPPWEPDPAPTELEYQTYRAQALAAANERGAAFVDMGASTPDATPYIVDWIHANADGHARIAAAVRAVL